MMMAVQEAGLVPDVDMLGAAMDACSKARDTEGAMHFMDQAIRLGLKPDDSMFREVRGAISRVVCACFVAQPRFCFVFRCANSFRLLLLRLERSRETNLESSPSRQRP